MTRPKFCKICGSEAVFSFDSGWKGQPRMFPYYRCSNVNCGFLYTDYLDSMSSEQVSAIYDSYWQDNSGKERSHLPLDKVKLAQILAPDANKILDIGSGEGWGVLTLREAGLEAYGYDIVPPKMCHEYITTGSREAITGQHDVITAIEVMEHLTDPVDACHWIASLLRPKGLFAFSTSTFNPRQHNQNWWYLKEVGHTSLHTRASLRCLAEKTGFKVVADIFSTHIWIRGDRVPLGSGIQIKTKHLVTKMRDAQSYRIFRSRIRNYGIPKR